MFINFHSSISEKVEEHKFERHIKDPTGFLEANYIFVTIITVKSQSGFSERTCMAKVTRMQRQRELCLLIKSTTLSFQLQVE